MILPVLPPGFTLSGFHNRTPQEGVQQTDSTSEKYNSGRQKSNE